MKMPLLTKAKHAAGKLRAPETGVGAEHQSRYHNSSPTTFYAHCMVDGEGTREPQYADLLEMRDSGSIPSLGLMAGGTWQKDPKRLVFTLSRYKFVAKMFEGQERVIEVGCADGFASRIVRQSVLQLSATDFDDLFIEQARSAADPAWPVDFFTHDILQSRLPGSYTAAYALDVLEHIDARDETKFLQNIADSLTDEGACIIGMPSLESQPYASPASVEGHVNCKTAPELRTTMQMHFKVVFLFSMNDEVVHTGFHKMANYLLGLGVGPRRSTE